MKSKVHRCSLLEMIKSLNDKKVAGLGQFLMDTSMYIANELPCNAEFQDIFKQVFEMYGDAKAKERMIRGGMSGPWMEYVNGL